MKWWCKCRGAISGKSSGLHYRCSDL